MSLRDALAHFVNPVVHSPFTARAERVLAVAADYADKSRASYIGTEHLAQALLDEQEGPHAQLIKPRIKVKV